MKTRVAMTALVLLVAAPTLAQGPGQRPGGGGGRPGGGGGFGGGRGMARLFDQLNLNEDQKGKLKVIQDDAKKKRDALDKETLDKVKKVLTPEQVDQAVTAGARFVVSPGLKVNVPGARL